MNKNKIEIVEYAKNGARILMSLKKLISTSSSKEINQLCSRLPDSITGDEGLLKLVFAGQYSAGKSSVISALTGRDDIPIGAGITTQYKQSYEWQKSSDWQGMEIIDTPGIHTSLRPDHDAITYQALSEADLLVFVITNELLDDHIAAHFRKLAIDRGKGYEMLLLVNKMQRHSKGNSAVAQQIVKDALRDMLAPFTPEDLHISFTDAKSALDAKAIADEKRSEHLYQKSGMNEFAKNLNQFIREKGFSSRYTTSLYTIEQLIQEALALSSTGNVDADGLEEVLLQRRRALVEEQQRIPDAVRNVLDREAEKIRSEGRKIADLIQEGVANEVINQEIVVSQKNTEEISDLIGQQVQNVIGDRLEQLEERLKGIMDSELAHELLPRLQKLAEEYLALPKMDKELSVSLQKGANISADFGKFLIKNSFNTTENSLKALSQLKNYSGTNAHNVVLKVGQIVGKKFKPWEAVKWAKHTANAGRVLAVAGAILSIYLAWREDLQEEQQSKELANARASIRSGFSEAAHAVETFYDEATNTFLTDFFGPQIAEVDHQLKELREMQSKRSEQYNSLIQLLQETQGLIQDIHQTHDFQ